jgi:hypothetical protein
MSIARAKVAAVRSGLALATGNVIVLQNPGLEYDPEDWREMYDLVAIRKVADVVYGTRFYGCPHRSLLFHHYLGNRLISFLFNALYNQTFTDVMVSYKMFSREVKESLCITCDDVGYEIQMSGQISLARRWRIYEVGIRYFGPTYEEMKKTSWQNELKTLWYLLRFRFSQQGTAHSQIPSSRARPLLPRRDAAGISLVLFALHRSISSIFHGLQFPLAGNISAPDAGGSYRVYHASCASEPNHSCARRAAKRKLSMERDPE